MKALRRRIEVLEGRRGDMELTPEEERALASDAPCWPTASIAMLKLIRAAGGLEVVILRSYELEAAR